MSNSGVFALVKRLLALLLLGVWSLLLFSPFVLFWPVSIVLGLATYYLLRRWPFKYVGVAAAISIIAIRILADWSFAFYPSVGGKYTIREEVAIDYSGNDLSVQPVSIYGSGELFRTEVFANKKGAMENTFIPVREVTEIYSPQELRAKGIELIPAGTVLEISGLVPYGIHLLLPCFAPEMTTPAGVRVRLQREWLQDIICGQQTCAEFQNRFGGKWIGFESLCHPISF